MAEKIKIFELDIDVDAAIKSQSLLKSELDLTKRSLDILKKTGDTSSETYVKLQANVKNLSREYNASQTQLGKLINLQGKEIKTVEQGRNALTILNKEWAKATNLYGANSKEAEALAKKHSELKNRVNELQKGIGDTSGNIGNYAEGMKEAIGQSSFLSKAQGVLNDAMRIANPIYQYARGQIKGIASDFREARANSQAYTLTQKASATATNLTSASLRLLKVALISTGIGAIIVLLGSLVAWFSKTQKGIDLVNKVLAALGAGFDVIIDRIAKLGGALIKLITGDFSGAFKDIKDSLSGIGDELQREITLAIKLEQVLQDVAKAEVNLDIRRSAANARLKELNKSIEDVTKSEEERLNAAKEFARIEQGLVSEEVANQEKRVAAMLGFAEVTEDVRKTIAKIGQEGVSLDQLGLSESTLEDAKEFRDEISKLFDLQTRSFEVQTTNQNKLNTIQNQIEAERKKVEKEKLEASKKAIAESIKEQQTRLKLFQEQNKGEKDTLIESIDFATQVRDKKLAILEKELKAGNKTKSEYELESLQIKNEFLEREKDLVIEYAQEELNVIKRVHQTRIQEGQFLSDTLVEQELNRLQFLAEKEREFQRQRLEEGVISQKEYNEAIAQVDAEYQIQKDELELERKEQKAEADAIDFENSLILKEERDGLIFEAQLLQLEKQRQAEIAQAEKVGADTTKIEEKYAIYKENIKQQEKDAKLSIQRDLFGGVAQLLGQETAAGKAAGIAAATINTYQGVTEVWRSKSVLPEPLATAAKVVNTGIVLGSGLQAVRNIGRTKTNVPRAAKGITLKGDRHSSGGIDLFDGGGNHLVNAEDGENIYVLNRNASALINGLSAVNELTGGVPLSTPTNFAMDGGLIQRSIQSNQSGSSVIVKTTPIDYDLMALKIGEANMNLPTPVTSVEEIIDKVSSYNQVKEGANI